MKSTRFFSAALIVAALSGCSQEEQLANINESCVEYTGTTEAFNSRIALGKDLKLTWQEGDQVSIFPMYDVNNCYEVVNSGSGTTKFNFVSYVKNENYTNVSAHYAVYPYNEGNTLSGEVITTSLPTAIEYSGIESSAKYNLMAAKSETSNLTFYNTQGYICLKLNAKQPFLYGGIKSIELKSATKALNGPVTIDLSTEKPVAVTTGTSEENKTLTINLAEALQTDLPATASGEFTEFYIPVIADEYKMIDGTTGDLTMTITWTDANKEAYVKNIAVDFTIGRHQIYTLRHRIGSNEYEGDLEGVTYSVYTNEDFVGLNGESGSAVLSSGSFSSEEDINFEGGQIQVQGEASIDMKDNTLIAGSASKYGLVATGTGNNLTIDNANLDSKGGGIGVDNGGSITFNSGSVAVNTTSTSGRYNFYVVGEGSTATINGGTFNFHKTLNQKRAYIYVGKGATVTVNGGTFGKASERSGYTAGILGDGTVIIKGGIFGFDPTKWVADGYQAVENAGNWYVIASDATLVANAEELSTVVSNGATNLYLAPGEYDIADCGEKTLTISGTKESILKVMNEGEDGADYGFDGSTVTLNNITINTGANTGNYKGYARMTATYNNCAIAGSYTTFQSHVFNNCEFNFNNGYLWTWGAESVTFDGCTFNGNSKNILAHGSASTAITIKDCTFAATEKGYTGSGDHTACVEIDPVGTNTYTINFTGNNTKTENYSGWTRIKDGSTGHTITGI